MQDVTLRTTPAERALIRRALPNFLNFMRFLHPVRACAARVAVPQQSWVGTGPCCIVKAQGGLCLVLAENAAKQRIIPALPRLRGGSNRGLSGGLLHDWPGLRIGRSQEGKRQHCRAKPI